MTTEPIALVTEVTGRVFTEMDLETTGICLGLKEALNEGALHLRHMYPSNRHGGGPSENWLCMNSSYNIVMKHKESRLHGNKWGDIVMLYVGALIATTLPQCAICLIKASGALLSKLYLHSFSFQLLAKVTYKWCT